MATSLIALGSNVATATKAPISLIKSAIRAIERDLASLVAISGAYQTPAFPVGSGPDYVNAVIAVETSRQPEDLLEGLHRIEAAFGRERSARWAARVLDLDLISYDDALLPSAECHAQWRNLPIDQQTQIAPSELILPHPRVQDRAFVLVPLRDAAPGWCHPAIGLTVDQMIARLPKEDLQSVHPIGDPEFSLETFRNHA